MAPSPSNPTSTATTAANFYASPVAAVLASRVTPTSASTSSGTVSPPGTTTDPDDTIPSGGILPSTLAAAMFGTTNSPPPPLLERTSSSTPPPEALLSPGGVGQLAPEENPFTDKAAVSGVWGSSEEEEEDESDQVGSLDRFGATSSSSKNGFNDKGLQQPRNPYPRLAESQRKLWKSALQSRETGGETGEEAEKGMRKMSNRMSKFSIVGQSGSGDEDEDEGVASPFSIGGGGVERLRPVRNLVPPPTRPPPPRPPPILTHIATTPVDLWETFRSPQSPAHLTTQRPADHPGTSSPPRLNPSSTSGVESTPRPRSSPSFGGMGDTSSAATAGETLTRGVRFGFVPATERDRGSRKELEYAVPAFPDVVQLSRLGRGPEEVSGSGDGGGGQGAREFGTFAVEARSWSSLLVYLMWHGNSAIESAPSDLQREKSELGLSCSIAIEFFMNDRREPRVRCRVDLLPSNTTYNAFQAAATTVSTFAPDDPSIVIHLPNALLLPVLLSSIAVELSAAHTMSRQKTYRASGEKDRVVKYLAPAVDMFKRIAGEEINDDDDDEVENEVSLLRRLKGRLKGRKRGPQLLPGGADGSEGGVPLQPRGRLPEGAFLVTPFQVQTS